MSFESQDLFQDLYEEWIDMVNQNIPLMPDVLSPEVESALRVNQQIVTRMHNIRRHLELNDFDQSYFLRNPAIPQPGGVSSTTLQNLLRMGTQNIDYGNSIASEMLQGVLDLLINNESSPITNLEDVKVVLSNNEFDMLEQLEVTKENLEEYENKECNVCIESYKNDEKLTRLPCQHIFHQECIRNWLCNENVKCPVCRNDTRQLNHIE
jgi:hypothetical protein